MLYDGHAVSSGQGADVPGRAGSGVEHDLEAGLPAAETTAMDKQMEAFFESVTTIKVQLPPCLAAFVLTSHCRLFFTLLALLWHGSCIKSRHNIIASMHPLGQLDKCVLHHVQSCGTFCLRQQLAILFMVQVVGSSFQMNLLCVFFGTSVAL